MLVKKYDRPKSLQEALKLAAEPGDVRILAGGTDLNILLRERAIRPDAIVDLSAIEELKKIEYKDGVVHVGSMVTFSQAEKDPVVLEYIPMLAEAAATVGSPQIRNAGTVGGNLCNAATAADTVPTFMAMDAVAVIKSVNGERVLPVTDIPTGLNKTCLEKGEILVEFQVKPTTGKFAAFEKIGRRKALAISRINMGMVLDLDGKLIKAASVAFGAVGKTAYRMAELEEFLAGKELSEALIADAKALTAEIITKVLNGRSTTPYKKAIGAAVVGRALVRAMGGDAE